MLRLAGVVLGELFGIAPAAVSQARFPPGNRSSFGMLVGSTSVLQREFLAGVRSSETVPLFDPVMPVLDSLFR